MSTAHPDQATALFVRKAGEQQMTLDDAQLAVLPFLAAAGNPGAGRSVYFWGPPGRGKTWLLDTFYAAAELQPKRRLHFHDFFRELHARTFAGYGRNSSGQQSAFAAGLDALLGDARLLCFDEFHVNGPAEAAFVTRLLQQVLDRGTVLVATSNYAPDDLLPDPMFHHLFESGRKLITSRMEVVPLEGGVDYRTLSLGARTGFAAGHHVRRPDPGLLQAAELREPEPGEATVVQPGTVPLKASRAHNGQLWFTFAELCESRSAASDYLALAEEYRHWVVSGVPETTAAGPYAWQRFGNLVDVLYDAGCRLDVLGFSDYDGRFPGTAHEHDRARISSRFGMLAVQE